MKINLYPEMNSKIADIMRVSKQPAQMYGAALIDAYRASGLEPDEIPQLKVQLEAAVADLKSCRLDHVRTCANYQKCFDKAKEEFRMMPCMSKSCPGWEWRGPAAPKEEK